MNTVTQKMKFRQSLIKHSLKYGITRRLSSIMSHDNTFYFWKRRYDGTLQSLAKQSHTSEHHSNQHTDDKIKLINDIRSPPLLELVHIYLQRRKNKNFFEKTLAFF